MLRTSRRERPDGDESGIDDDRLRLMFTCCHPALPVEAQVALTLRSLAGLTTPEIARAFLVPQETMAKRLTRAKRKITEARIPYRVPAAHRLGERLRAVLVVIYALFNEGYGASAGDELIRKDLCVEAIRLGRLLAELMPDEPEALGLLSLMLLQDSRRAARVGTDGELVTLEDQDRESVGPGRDRGGVHRARSRHPAATARSLPVAGGDRGVPRERATRAVETDWREIVVLYDRLSEIVATPVVLLNRAVAVAMAEGPASGLTTGRRAGRNRRAGRLLPAAGDPRRSAQTPRPLRGGRGRVPARARARADRRRAAVPSATTVRGVGRRLRLRCPFEPASVRLSENAAMDAAEPGGSHANLNPPHLVSLHPPRQAHARAGLPRRVPRFRRHDDRQRRAAVHPPRPRVLRREPAVGHQRIPADLRRTAAPRRPRRRPARPPPAARGRDYAVRAVLPDRRPRRQRCRDDRARGSPRDSARR